MQKNLGRHFNWLLSSLPLFLSPREFRKALLSHQGVRMVFTVLQGLHHRGDRSFRRSAESAQFYTLLLSVARGKSFPPSVHPRPPACQLTVRTGEWDFCLHLQDVLLLFVSAICARVNSDSVLGRNLYIRTTFAIRFALSSLDCAPNNGC